MRAKGRRRPIPPKQPPVEDLHECWAAVKGQKFPPFGYVVRWNDPTTIVVFKYAITGKYRDGNHTAYRAEYRGIFYKTHGYVISRFDILKSLEGVPRHDICFTLEEVERYIERHRMGHINKHHYMMQKLNHEMETISNSMKYTSDVLRSLGDHPIPRHVIEKLPRRVSKRVL